MLGGPALYAMQLIITSLTSQNKFSMSIPLGRDRYVEPELSAHDQAAVPPTARYESIMPTSEPYVPATIRKLPAKMTNTLQQTISRHPSVGLTLPRLQLS